MKQEFVSHLTRMLERETAKTIASHGAAFVSEDHAQLALTSIIGSFLEDKDLPHKEIIAARDSVSISKVLSLSYEMLSAESEDEYLQGAHSNSDWRNL